MVVIFSLIIIMVIAGITINYTIMARDYQENEQTLRNMTEANLVSSFIRMDTGLKMYDNTYNDRMEEGFSIVMEEYNLSGGDPSHMDLLGLKERTGMSIYIINTSGVIEYSTSPPDIGLDFSVIYPDFYQYLQTIWYTPGFYPDRIVTEWVSGALTKFAYMPTYDHRYVIELGLTSERIAAERRGLRYGDIREDAQEFNPYIDEIRIWQKQKRVVGNASYNPDAAQSETLDRILRDRTSLEFSDPDGKRLRKWLFVDMRDPRYAADMSLIVEIVYNKAKIESDLQTLVFYHLLVAGIGLFGGGILAFILARRFSKPIQGIVADVDRISQGDLSHRISPPTAVEFESIETSINAMVQTLKGTILQLQESEDALKKSEERYRSVVETQNEMIARFLPDGTHVFVNDTYCRYFGLSCSGIIGTQFRPTVFPDDIPALNGYFTTFSPEHPEGTIEHRIILPGGEVRWQQWNDRALFDTAGNILEYQSVGRDITDRKNTDAAFQAMVKSMVGTTGIDSLRKIAENISSWLSADCVMIGDLQPDMEGVRVLAMYLDGKVIPGYSYSLKGTPCQNTVDKGYCIFHDNVAQLFPGSRDLIELHIRGYLGTPLRNAEGQVVGVMCALFRNPIQPIPSLKEIIAIIAVKASAEIERMRIIAVLEESEEKYRTLVESANSIILRFTSDGTITFANPYALSFFGFSRDALLGRNVVGSIVPETDRDNRDLRKMILDITIHPDLYKVHQNENMKRDGKRVWISWTNKVIQSPGSDVSEVLSIGNDITRLKEMEEELQLLNEMLEQKVAERTLDLENANKELEAFSYSVSHDLRAPLRAIDGFSYMLLSKHSDQLSEEGARYLERIRYNVYQMGQLIDAILNFSRMSRQPLVDQTVYPSPLVKEIIEELLPQGEGRDIKFNIKELPPLTGDPSLVRQVFSNLLSNAMKFTRKRDPAKIEVGSMEKDGRIVYYVRDNGVGFDMQYRDKIFGVFQRLHPAQEYEGAGIGLTIVQRIIQRYRGAIWVESEVDKGTTVFFTFGGSPAS
jgi:PAS domain S-box-containing protein